MLTLKGITKIYKTGVIEVEALRGIDLSFRQNEFVSILGPSGCGKTTLLNIIGGLDKYTDGDLLINRKSTKDFTSHDWDIYRNHRVGFVFQSYNLIPHQTVLGNVELALTIAGVSKDERIRRAKEALDRVGLKGLYYKRPNQLSGGQCQRVAIARALVNDPEILLADEPTGALDTTTSIQIMDLIKEISKERLVIMVTHNPELAEKYSTRIIRLLDGKVTEDTMPFTEEEDIEECNKIEEEMKIEAKNKANENSKKSSKKQKEQSKMSFLTAFKLSARNLISKKGRTILVGIAGSIGIIGIAMVLAFSAGIKNFIASMQDDMLSGNPITIRDTIYDMSALANMMSKSQKEEIIKEPNKVYVDSIIEYIAKTNEEMENVVINNEITQDYIDYLLAMPKDTYAAILLDYGIDLTNNVYTDFTVNNDTDKQNLSISGIKSIYTSILENTELSKYSTYITSLTEAFKQAPNNKDYILSQYDILKGRVATKANEIMIVLDKNSRLSDILLAQLGYYSQEEFINIVYEATESEKFGEASYKEYFTYDELLGKTFKWYPNDTIFTSTDRPITPFTYSAYSDDFKDDDALELKVVGILQPKEDISYGCLTAGVYYTEALSKHVLDTNKDSEIITYLNENETDSFISMNNQGIDTGITFKYSYFFDGTWNNDVTGYVGTLDQMTSFMGSMSESNNANKYYILNKQQLGGIDIPNSIYIYPINFDTKDEVTDYLDRWNEDGDITVNNKKLTKSNRNEIAYQDTLSLIISIINNMINIVSYALIAFTSISLVVSTVMIGIITYISVVERIKEIGVIRSLGGRKIDVSNLFLAETFIIGLLSGLIGIGITYLLSALANVIINALIGINNIAALPIKQAIFLISLSVILTLISGLMPAISAAKKDPAVALRTE